MLEESSAGANRPAESLTKPAAYPKRGIYTAPCCTRRGRDRKVVSPLWRKANINGGWSRMGFCCLKDGHETG
nr:MAG TPA: hypothetical protein [Caudoviricetes sp.]